MSAFPLARALAFVTALLAAPVALADTALEEIRALRVQGNPQAALQQAAIALEDNPEHVGYRFEGGVALAEMGRCRDARRVFADIKQRAPYAHVLESVNAASSSLCPTRANVWERSLSGRFIADGNYNNATSANSIFLGPFEFALDSNARAQERYGVELYGHIGKQIGLTQTLAVVPFIGAGAAIVNDRDDTRLRFSPGVALDWATPTAQWRVGPVVRFEYSPNGYISHTAAIDGRGTLALGPRTGIDWSASIGQATHKNELDDGVRARAEIGVVRLFEGNQRVRLSMSHGLTERSPTFRTERETRAQISYGKRLNKNFAVEAFASVSKLKADDVHPFFQVKRDDTIKTIGLAVSLHQWETKWGTPVIGVSHTRATSPIVLHDYAKNAIFLNFSRSF